RTIGGCGSIQRYEMWRPRLLLALGGGTFSFLCNSRIKRNCVFTAGLFAGGGARATSFSTHQTEKEKATLISERGLYLCRQRPTLPHTFACSTIGPAGLNFRVRDGNGWIPRGKITDNLKQLRASSHELRALSCPVPSLR